MTTKPDWRALSDLDPARPGIVAAIVRDGSIEAWGSFGSSEPGGEPLVLETPFYVGSIAKQFTAGAIAVLVLEGTIGLDDSVSTWLPEVGPSWAAVRVHHLVEHTSGLPDSNAADVAAGFTMDHPFTGAERLAVVLAEALEHEPGAVHAYRNHGYVVLGAIVTRASGMPLGTFARERFFDPLGMADTNFIDVASPPIVTGWVGGRRPVSIRFTSVGDGGLVSTVADLARWDRWLPSAPIATLLLGERPTLPDGLLAHDAWGISIRSHHGRRIESHGSSFDGYLGSFIRFPELATSVIALANTDEYGVAKFGIRTRRLVDDLFPAELDRDRPPWTETHGSRREPPACGDGFA